MSFKNYLIIITGVLLMSCSQYDFDYLYDNKDNSHVVTRIRHRGHTYFVYGKYEKEELPESGYLKIGTLKRRADYQLFLYWKKDTAYIESLQGGVYTPVNLPEKFIFVEDSTNNIDRFIKLRRDTTGYYTFICDCDHPAPIPDPEPEYFDEPLIE